MSELSDLLDILAPALPGIPDAAIQVITSTLKIKVSTSLRLECWSLENMLLFRGEFNPAETSPEGDSVQWGKGFYGLRMRKCDESEWFTSLRDQVGRGDNPEDSLDALFMGQHAEDRLL